MDTRNQKSDGDRPKWSTSLRLYEAAAALLIGAGTTALVSVSLDLLVQTRASMFLAVFLTPGGILQAIIFGDDAFSPPVARVIAANTVIYGIGAYLGFRLIWRDASLAPMRRLTCWLLIPVTMLFVLANLPVFNPFRGHGMEELGKQETDLRATLREGLSVEQARLILESRHIQFSEWEEKIDAPIMESADEKIEVKAGDRIIAARFPTEAGQFPCGYNMQIVLVFGQDHKLKRKHVARYLICP